MNSPRLRELNQSEFAKIATDNVDDPSSSQVLHVRKIHDDEMDQTKHTLLKAEIND